VDIIHTFFEKSEVMGWVVARLAKIPIWVTSRRDLGFKRKEIYDRLFGLTGRGCRRLVANCQAIKEEVIQHEKFPGQKVEVIYNGLDFFIYEKAYENAHLRMGLGIENGSPVIGMVANFNFEIKGHKYFLEAAKKVNEKFPNARFLLIGDGPLKQKYEEMAEELGVPKSVLFLGKRGDVPAVMSSFDVSVLASTSEGFSNVILESMAAGKPVVATNVGGSKEMVLDGITGYLVPPANSDALAEKILMLLRNPDDAGAMGAEGRRIIQERFTVGVMVKKYENLYRSLIGEYFSEVSVHSVRDIR
jgi:glycosyltransferase involved in cell wall biosynthesis